MSKARGELGAFVKIGDSNRPGGRIPSPLLLAIASRFLHFAVCRTMCSTAPTRGGDTARGRRGGAIRVSMFIELGKVSK